MLDTTFPTPYSKLSRQRQRELTRVASTAISAVLAMLNTEPLELLASLAAPQHANAHDDPQRSALKASAKPKGRDLLQLIAASPLAASLVHSYIASTQRKEPMAVRAQILAPLTQQYSLRMFNECFDIELEGIGGVTRYSWMFARWHCHVWKAGQTPPAQRPWRRRRRAPPRMSQCEGAHTREYLHATRCSFRRRVTPKARS